MSGRNLAGWFAGAFALALLLAAPLQLVLPRLPLPAGLSAAEVGGSLGRGRLRAVHWHGVDHGDVDAGLSPLPLLTGRQRLWLRGDDARLALAGGRLRGLDGGDGVLPLPPLAGLALRVSLEDARLLFDDSGCRQAGGRVRIEITLPGDTLPPQLLTGTPACEGRTGSLVLVTEGAGGPLWLGSDARGRSRRPLHAADHGPQRRPRGACGAGRRGLPGGSRRPQPRGRRTAGRLIAGGRGSPPGARYTAPPECDRTATSP
ncbi:type II secretion system protein N [Luteimonas granuli]|uniref:type II secretion system protein N n=1 Tax=Luteimonas granuli TaxID=1176533 RepID=UPI00143DD202|nr:type II secretion system protein N [Luteimonas granuli]